MKTRYIIIIIICYVSRNGILPLQLEVGRWINKTVCLICNNSTVEDEEHFLFHCNFY